MKFLNNLDLQSNELQNAVIHNYAGNPDGTLSGTQGQVVYSSTLNQLYVNTDDSTSWDALSSSAGVVASITGGNAITVGGTSTVPIINHDDTSSLGNLTASSRTYVTGLTFDTYGHVTALATGTETVTNSDTNTTYTTSTLQSGSDAIIRLTAGGSGSGNDDLTIAAGATMTITESGDTITLASTDTNHFISGSSFSGGTLTLTGGGSAGTSVSLDGRYLTAQSSDFGTIAVAGQTSVNASSAGDTVTYVAAGGMTITTATDTVTFSSANTNNIDFVSGASFATGTGILTLTGTGSAGATVDLDGRYLQSYNETDTLDDVTGRGATTTNAVTTGDLTVNGDLTVSGAHTITLAEEVKVEDSIFVLNSNETGAPSEDAGLVIERGTSTNVAMLWDESADEFALVTSNEVGTTAGNVTIADYAPLRVGAAKVDDTLTLGSVVNAGTDTDKFLVLDASGNVDFRTGAEVRSDIGAGTGSGTMSSFTISDGSNTSPIANGNTLAIQGSGLVSVAESAGTVTISTTANNYAHPTLTARSINTSGAEVIDILTSNTDGHVTAASKRTMTLADLGYTGTTNANTYVHPTLTARSVNTSGASVLDTFTSNTDGHVTAITTRTLTLANLGYTGSATANDYLLPSANTTTVGGVELATTTEASAGSDTSRAVTAAGIEKFRNDRESVTTLSGTGAATAFTITHNFGTRMVMAEIVDFGNNGTAATYESVYADVTRPTDNTLIVTFGTAPSTTQDYKVMLRLIA